MSDIRYMLDASAVLAMMLGEGDGDEVRKRLPSSQISTVNLSEVVAKLQEGGVPDEVITSSLAELDFDVLAFDQNQAVRAGLLRAATRGAGLSLGDRACLSAATASNAVAVTTDRAWGKVDVEIAIEVLR
jgi:ribonuclease VapC